ncbi:UNVERIFIED_CONTAM: hypothetical protein FKN15_043525 [Acipenser sinensis]
MYRKTTRDGSSSGPSGGDGSSSGPSGGDGSSSGPSGGDGSSSGPSGGDGSSSGPSGGDGSSSGPSGGDGSSSGPSGGDGSSSGPSGGDGSSSGPSGGDGSSSGPSGGDGSSSGPSGGDGSSSGPSGGDGSSSNSGPSGGELGRGAPGHGGGSGSSTSPSFPVTGGTPGDAEQQAAPGDAEQQAAPGDAEQQAAPGDARQASLGEARQASLGKARQGRSSPSHGGRGGTSSKGPEWYRIRSALNPKMLKMREVSAYAPVVNEVVTDLLHRIYRLREQSPDGTAVQNLAGELYKFGFEGISSILFEARLGCLDEEIPEDTQKFIRAVGDMLALSETVLFFPKWTRSILPYWKRFVSSWDDISDVEPFYVLSPTLISAKMLIDRKVKEIHQKTEKGETVEGMYLTNLLSSNKLSLSDIYTSLTELLLGGVDTTSNTMSWTLYHLARAPAVQTRLYREIAEVCPGRRIPTAEHLSQMHYMKAVIKETLRPDTLGWVGRGSRQGLLNCWAGIQQSLDPVEKKGTESTRRARMEPLIPESGKPAFSCKQTSYHTILTGKKRSGFRGLTV